MSNTFAPARNAVLRSNADLLQQAASVLESIDDGLYQRPATIFDGQRIGGHVRHVIEFYEALLAGLDDGIIDYDARKRDPLIESDRRSAIDRLRRLEARLKSDTPVHADGELWVAVEGDSRVEGRATFFRSSIGRELQAVSSHTVHHFALIAMLLKYYGLAVPADFGVSKATLQFRARESAREAA